MPLTERVEERDLLLNLFKECTDGKGSAVLVTGTEGYGKTELLNNFISYAGQQGALTLQATCSPIEKEIPLIAIGQLLNSTETPDELADETAEFLKLRKETLSNGNTHPNSIQKPVEVIEGFHRLLSRISDHTPLVIAVDDIHYVDIPSLQCLLHFIRHMRTSRTLIVMTESPSISTVHPLFHSDLLSQQHCHQANLHPLTNDGVYTIITRELGDSTEFKLKVEFVRASGGNPILLHALIKDYRSAGSGADDNIVIGPSFRQAVTTILHRIDRSLIRAAQGLALLSESDSVALLDRLLRISSGTASRALQTLTDIGLVSNGAFRHPLVGEALLDELSAEERKDMHHRVARLLHIHGTPPSMVAAHLLTAGPVDAPWAIPVLREASEQALADNDRELSVRLLNLAHQIHPDKAAGASIRALLLENTWGLGSRTIRERLSALAADLREGYLNTRHAFLLARHLVWNGQANKVLDVLASLRKRAENGDPDAADEIDVIRTWLSCTQPQILGQGSTEPYPPHPTPMQDTRLLAPTLLRSALDSGPRDVPIGDVERTLRCSNLTEEGCSVTISALRSLIYTDRVDQALVWCDQLLRESVRIGRPEFGALLRTVQAEGLVRRGDLCGAHHSALESIALLTGECWGVGIGSPLSVLVLTKTGMGDHESAWKYLNHPVPHETYNTCYGLQFLYARGHYYLATGKAEDALVGFMSCGDLLRTWRIDWPGFLPWRARAAEAEARLGNGSSARSLIEEQLSLLESERTRTWALSLRVLAEVSEPAKRPGLLKEASRILHTCGDNLELARALAALSQAHHLLGDARQARLVFRRAQEVAKKCGALLNDTPPASRRTPQPLNSEPVGPGSDLILELSDAERRVASLATQGYSNREISNRLYITTSTVEQHLTRVYRKLGISGRKDLPVDLYFDGLIPL